MSRLSLAALTVAALTAAYLWAINATHADMANRPARPWDEYGDIDAHPIDMAWAGCSQCGWATSETSEAATLQEFAYHRAACHGI